MAIIISRTIHGNNVKDEEKRPDLTENPAVVQTLEQVFGRLEQEHEYMAAERNADRIGRTGSTGQESR